MKQYVCGKCGWHGEVEKTHVSVGEHKCPQCGTAGYHFLATPEILKLFHSFDGASWVSDLCADDACETCWSESGMTKPDYDFYTIPATWVDDTKHQCSDRSRGIAARIEFDNIPHKASVRSLTRGEVIKEGAWFHVGLTTGGRHGTTEHHWLQTWEEAIALAEEWIAQEGETHLAKIANRIAVLQETAKAKNFKPGWVWYRVKDEFGLEVANTMLPKVEA